MQILPKPASSQPYPLTKALLVQIEVACHFAIGTFDSTETYCDELRVIVTKYLTTVDGFWFDCITSIPWSFMDFAVYRVLPTPTLKYDVVAPTVILRILGDQGDRQV